MIQENSHKYSISAMCKMLSVSRSTFYYQEKPKKVDSKLENAVIEEFRKSRNNYGTRKLKIVLARQDIHVSRFKIGKIMAKYNLISNYTLRNKKYKKSAGNMDNIPNKLDRKFDEKEKYEVIVSDLTYIKIAGQWKYLCLMLDLCGRKIVGSAVGNQRNAKLVEQAFRLKTKRPSRTPSFSAKPKIFFLKACMRVCNGRKKAEIRWVEGFIPDTQHHRPPQRPGPQAGSNWRQTCLSPV